MIDENLQGSRDKVFSKFYLRFWLRLNPNTISTIGFIIGIFCIIFILQKLFLIALVLWFLNRFFDGLDGFVARKTGKQTELGAYLDILYSFFIYSFFIFALILVNIKNEEIVIAGSLLLCLYYVNSVSWAFLSLLIEKQRKSSEIAFAKENLFPPALVEKGETIIFYMFFLLFSELNLPIPNEPFQFRWLTILFLLFGALILLSIIQRLLLAREIFPVDRSLAEVETES